MSLTPPATRARPSADTAFPSSTTSSLPSISSRRTLTVWAREVGIFLAHVVSAYRELTVASVNENEELNGTGSPEIDQGIERGSDGASGKEDVVDEDYVAAGDAAGYGRAGAVVRLSGGASVVAVGSRVQGGDRDLAIAAGRYIAGDALGEGKTSGADADKEKVGGVGMGLDELMGYTAEGLADVGGGTLGRCRSKKYPC